jgi:IclR family mhp operon transcriptional activator
MRTYRVKTIRALDRGLQVLAYLHRSRAASLHDLHLTSGLPKATLTRVLATLQMRGLIWQRLADGAFMASHTFQPRARQAHDEALLAEVASPILEKLCRQVNWPSILAVSRLDHMEVIETNRSKSYFSHIPVGPVGFRVNMLRSAAGRAYLAFCSENERQAILQRLAASVEPGDLLARRPHAVEKLLAETRALGYGIRAPDFGGHYNLTRRQCDDHRSSFAVPIGAAGQVIAAVNLTWINKVVTLEQMVKTCLPPLRAAANDISDTLSGLQSEMQHRWLDFSEE